MTFPRVGEAYTDVSTNVSVFQVAEYIFPLLLEQYLRDIFISIGNLTCLKSPRVFKFSAFFVGFHLSLAYDILSLNHFVKLV